MSTESFQAAEKIPGGFESRIEYGHQTLELGWIAEWRGIKYASHQREVVFRCGEPVLLDHWSDPSGRRIPVTEVKDG